MVAARYANDRPGKRSRVLADNFPALATVDPSGDDDAVLNAASAMVGLLTAIHEDPDPPFRSANVPMGG